MFQDSLVNVGLIQAQIKHASSVDSIKKNLSQLLHSIQKKNMTFSYATRNGMLDRVTVEMDKRGVNTVAIDKLASDCLEKSKKSKLLKNSVFDKRAVDHMAVEEYIEKRSEESRLNLVYQLMSERRSLNDLFKERVAQRLQSQNTTLAKDPNRDKKIAYTKAMKKFIKLKSEMSAIDLIREFKQSGTSPIWNILEQQFNHCQQYLRVKDTDKLKQKIRQNTLHILQDRFQLKMPKDDRNFAIKCQQLVNNDKKKAVMKNERPYWAICYYLLRCGNIRKLREVLSETNTRQIAQIAQIISSMLKSPELNYAIPKSVYSDVYLEQINNILLKKPLADPIFVQNIEDFIWLALKTCPNQEFSPSWLHDYVIGHYVENPNSVDMLEAVALSLNFQALQRIQNANLTILDNTHLGIVYELCNFHTDGLTTVPNRQMSDFMSGDILSVVAYLPLQDTHRTIRLLIENNKVEEFTSLVCDPVQRQTISKAFKSQEQFSQFIKQLSGQLLKNKKHYVKAARMMMDVTNNMSDVMQIIIHCQLQSLLNSSFSPEELSGCMQIMQQFARRRELGSKQSTLMNFVREYRLLEAASKNKNPEGIIEARQNSIYFPKLKTVGTVLTEECRTALVELSKYNYLDVFINFTNLIIYANDIVFSYVMAESNVYKESLLHIQTYVLQIEQFLKKIGTLKSTEQMKFKEIKKSIQVRMKS